LICARFGVKFKTGGRARACVGLTSGAGSRRDPSARWGEMRARVRLGVWRERASGAEGAAVVSATAGHARDRKEEEVVAEQGMGGVL
jgi:hypothetical protein